MAERLVNRRRKSGNPGCCSVWESGTLGDGSPTSTANYGLPAVVRATSTGREFIGLACVGTTHHGSVEKNNNAWPQAAGGS